MLRKGLLTTTLLVLTSYFVIAGGIDYKTYSIQLISYSKVLEDDEFNKALKQFDKLENLGYVYETSYLSPNNMVPSKFYLGSYVGLHTAKRILKKVRKKGFKDAFIIADIKISNPYQTKNYNVVQIGSYKRLLMKNFKKLSDDVGQGYVSVALADDGSYKVLLTCFDDNDTKDELKDAKDYGFMTWKRDIRNVYKVKTKAKAKKKAAIKKPIAKPAGKVNTKPPGSSSKKKATNKGKVPNS